MQKSFIMVLKADAGKVLTDGSSYVSSVMLRDGSDGSEWSEIDRAEYERIQKEEMERIEKERSEAENG